MSVINGVYNQQLRSAVGITVSGTSLYFTLPWHPQSTIDEIRFTNLSGTAMTVTNMNILDAGAHYRNSTTDGKSHVILRDPTDKNVTSNEAYWTNWTFSPGIYHENLYDRPYLNLQVTLTASVSNVPVRISAVGKKALPSTAVKSENLGLEVIKDYRVLISKSGTGGTDGTLYDVTGVAKGTGGENASQFNFSSTNDYLYIGSSKKIDHWDFQIGTGATIGGALVTDIWNGSAWSSFAIVDDTSSGNSDTLKFSGIIEGSGLGSSVWAPVKFDYSANSLLPNDPLTVQQNRIIAGGYPIVVLPPNPERYWVRFRLNTLATGNIVTFNKILPVAEVYETF